MTPKGQLPKRPRLRGFDYAESGYYFVTIVADHKICTLSTVVDSQIVLSDLGAVLEDQLLSVTEHYPHVAIDSYVIMPNHVHVLLHLDRSGKSVTLSRVVNEIKSKTTVRYHKLTNRKASVWQYGYYDVIIRSEKQLFAIRQYIKDNPVKWELDGLNRAS
jgi:REP element-mobilizing transposase RayT